LSAQNGFKHVRPCWHVGALLPYDWDRPPDLLLYVHCDGVWPTGRTTWSRTRATQA